MVLTSLSRGTFWNVLAPVGRRADASSGSAAFLAPLTCTSPLSRWPPWMTILSMRGRT